MSIRMTDDLEHRRMILDALYDNYCRYGKRYCPCSVIRDNDTVCPCKDFRDMKEGICHCGLYIKENEEKVKIPIPIPIKKRKSK